ncbi:MAG: hypothetical protein EA412_14400 [Chitinophagaceae bacterium]|nr:MAG: hypothetical protein EA412_14400 [Chitinophagaceae bacterium]
MKSQNKIKPINNLYVYLYNNLAFNVIVFHNKLLKNERKPEGLQCEKPPVKRVAVTYIQHQPPERG